MRAQPVDATRFNINLVSKGGVFDARETGEAFRDAEGRHVKPLENGVVELRSQSNLGSGLDPVLRILRAPATGR